MITQQKNKVKK